MYMYNNMYIIIIICFISYKLFVKFKKKISENITLYSVCCVFYLQFSFILFVYL